jgi:pimeloyl-ACP methyl ester carboxylesterase
MRKGMPLRLTLLYIALVIGGAAAYTQTMEDLPYPPDTRKVTLPNGIQIAYVDRGEGPYTLLLLHGLGTYLKAWLHNTDALAMQSRCIAIDLPGYGKSSKGDYPFSMSFFAEQVALFCEQLGLSKVVLVGHSMGGQIALTLALQKPTLVERLVLLAPAGIETFTADEASWLKAVYTPETLKNASEQQIRKNFLANFYRWPPDAEILYTDRLALRQTVEYDDWCRMIPQCVRAMLDEPVFDRLQEIKQPTLILFGTEDALIPNRILHPTQSTLQIGQLAQVSIPGSQLRFIPQAGHMLQWEQAAAVNDAIKAFLAE